MFFDVVQDALIIAVVAFASSISVADLFARKHDYKIDSNKVDPRLYNYYQTIFFRLYLFCFSRSYWL